MKKILLLFCFSSFLTIHAQDTSQHQKNIRNHELKLNSLNLALFSALDISYEYILNNQSSVGASVYILTKTPGNENEIKLFSMTPFYRKYFSAKRANGFFAEGFGMINIFDKTDEGDFIDKKLVARETNLAIGVSIGTKFLFRENFVVEAYLGVGTNLINNSEIDTGNNNQHIIGRSGLLLGYRF